MENERDIKYTQNNGIQKKPFINTSGRGEDAKVPSSVKDKFNWGAFLLSWIWGLGNKTYITLLNIILFFIPLVNIAAAIWFGIKGNEWAWRNKRFEGIKQFHESQKKWAIAGTVFSLVLIPIVFMIFVGGITAYSVKTVMDNPEKLEQIKTNMEKFMDEAASTYFETYTISENENIFYVTDDIWSGLSFSDRKNLLDLAATTAANKKEKEYKAANPNGHKYFSKTDELNKTKIYSANNRNKLYGEFYIDENLLNDSNASFGDYMKAGMKAYRFYN